MAKESSKNVKKSLAANEPVNLCATVSPGDHSALNGQQAGLRAAAATATQATQSSVAVVVKAAVGDPFSSKKGSPSVSYSVNVAAAWAWVNLLSHARRKR
jgi:hypothetical protein